MPHLIKLFYRPGLLGLAAVVFILVGCEADGSRPGVTPIAGPVIPVAPEFRAFYYAYGGSDIFGEPLAEAFFYPESDRLIQYFTRMRLEFMDDAASEGLPPIERVAIYPLGEWAYAGVTNPTIVPVLDTGRERHFPETEYTVRDSFLQFYEANHGETLFGLPISELIDGGGKTVQYFHNVRLEWHPYLPPQSRVQVGLLGRNHFDSAGMGLLYSRGAIAQPQLDTGVEQAIVDPAVSSRIVYQGDLQELSVRVQTVDGRPVERAGVYVELIYGDVVREEFVGLTNSLGVWRGSLDVTAIPSAETVQLRAKAFSRNGRALGEGSTSFRTWY